jgi:glycopeptide antibiotics resistance protein
MIIKKEKNRRLSHCRLILYLIPFLLLVYYLWSNWSSLRSKPLIPGIFIVGILLWLSGMGLFSSDPKDSSLVRLGGIVLILLGMIIDSYFYKNKPS